MPEGSVQSRPAVRLDLPCASSGTAQNPQAFSSTSLTSPFMSPPCPASTQPLRQMPWLVYAKRPFGGPEQVLEYLGRYTHRVAIANSRVVELTDSRVGFLWKDYRHHDKRKVMTLDAGEFIRRFLLHVLPGGFHRIRHYGYLANGHRVAKLTRCRQLLAAPTPVRDTPATDYRERMRQLTGRAIDVCPCCGGHMVEIGCIPPTATVRNAPAWNTS